MKVRIIKPGKMFGKQGVATWISEKGLYEVEFKSPWVGYFKPEEVELY